MKPTFSAIVVTYNGLADLRKCIQSLDLRRNPAWELLVVDNASSDGIQDYLLSLADPAIRFIPLSTNTGFAYANNHGFEQASGEWIFLLNNDATCGTDTLSALEEATSHCPDYCIFACHMIRASDGKVDNLGIQFTRSLRGVQIGAGMDNGWQECREVFGASGGAMLLHRSVIEDIGLFDAHFFAYQEDVEFAVRARLAGYRCLYLPRAIVRHKGGGTSSRRSNLFRYYNQRNMEVLLRCLPARIIWKYGALHLTYIAYQIVKWTAKGDGLNVCRAKIDGLKLAYSSRRHLSPVRISSKAFDAVLARI
jgi:GT2 family glycosyltransferase